MYDVIVLSIAYVYIQLYMNCGVCNTILDPMFDSVSVSNFFWSWWRAGYFSDVRAFLLLHGISSFYTKLLFWVLESKIEICFRYTIEVEIPLCRLSDLCMFPISALMFPVVCSIVLQTCIHKVHAVIHMDVDWSLAFNVWILLLHKLFPSVTHTCTHQCMFGIHAYCSTLKISKIWQSYLLPTFLE